MTKTETVPVPIFNPASLNSIRLVKELGQGTDRQRSLNPKLGIPKLWIESPKGPKGPKDPEGPKEKGRGINSVPRQGQEN